uniref:FkbM family methyltransferase n=1 Tax=Pricia sp. TaxID=2268138 RepID=UPI00359403A9
GANIGYYSILGCKINPSLTVYAFEPSIGVMIYMRENLKINNLLDKVFIEPIALSDVSGTIDFYEMRNLKFPTIYNLSGEHNLGAKKDRISNKIKVESITLDAYLDDKKIDSVDLIKLDTEGAEYQILTGATHTLNKFKPIIICETLFNSIEKELDAVMRKNEYRFYNHTNQGLEHVDTIIRVRDNGVRNCFFVPAEKVHLIEEWIV